LDENSLISVRRGGKKGGKGGLGRGCTHHKEDQQLGSGDKREKNFFKEGQKWDPGRAKDGGWNLKQGRIFGVLRGEEEFKIFGK